MTLFKLSGFTYTYYNRTSPAISDITFDISEGEFVLICGQSGCGKSTLLSCMKGLQDRGAQKGELTFCEKEVVCSDTDIGYAAQHPDEQIVTDKVWHELSFGAENAGMNTSQIRSRIAETALFFGIEKLLYRRTDELSGGQKQIISLASLLVMRPRILLLDEPLSQLDPIAAQEFIDLLGRINRELGIAVVIAEHRLDSLMPLADKVIVMDGGKIIENSAPDDIPELLDKKNHAMFCAMPSFTQAAAVTGEYPLNVKQAKAWYKAFAESHKLILPPKEQATSEKELLCSVKDVYFSYDKNTPVLIGLSMDIYKGEMLAITGGNAAGKSTLLMLLCNALKPIGGSISYRNKPKFGYLPQDPSLLFSLNSVKKELYGTNTDENAIQRAIKLCRLEGLLECDPLDLSGGERQRAALAKLFAAGCDMLLLDEPTKGLDASYKRELSAVLRQFCSDGGTVVLVTHDNDFCAENADRIAMLFGGEVTSETKPAEFFTQNSFYTTDSAKTAQGVADGIYTARELIRSVGGQEKEYVTEEKLVIRKSDDPPKPDNKKPPIGKLRKICTLLGVLSAVGVMVFNSGIFPISIPSEPFFLPYLPLILPVVLLIIGISPQSADISPVNPKALRKKDIALLLCFAVIIIATAVIFMKLSGGKMYIAAAMLILIECFIPFLLILKDKKPSAKDVAAMAVICAAAVAGREIFFMLPQFKPTAAIVITAAAAFGAQPGFIIGAAAMLISNMLYGQGAWTVWQMLGMGLTAFFAGLIFSRRRSKTALCLYGFFSVLIIYGPIMNLSSLFMLSAEPSAELVLTTLAAGLPFDIIHAAATAVFLLLLSGLVARLDRLTAKYGLFE